MSAAICFGAPQTPVSLFKFNAQDIRVATLDGAPWFVAKDVCGVLGFKSNNGSVSHHLTYHLDDDDRRTISRTSLEVSSALFPAARGGAQRFSIISEAGLYDLSTIRKDSEGRYCLNDLHKAAGGEKKHQPSDFLRLTSTCALIRELNETSWNSGEYVRAVQDQSGDSRSAVKTTVGGSAPGTYVVKELVYAYAMWVSPAFHLKVIRFFDRGVKDGVAVADNAAADLLANLEGRALETSKKRVLTPGASQLCHFSPSPEPPQNT